MEEVRRPAVYIDHCTLPPPLVLLLCGGHDEDTSKALLLLPMMFLACGVAVGGVIFVCTTSRDANALVMSSSELARSTHDPADVIVDASLIAPSVPPP